MPFNSVSYILFLALVYLIFQLTVDRWRWLVLLAGSYGFYAALHAPYLLMALLILTIISYSYGLQIAAQKDEEIRKRLLWYGVFACTAVLVLLKYLPSFEAGGGGKFTSNSPHPMMLVSIGVSYYTFQAISYLADIYLDVEEPEQHFGYYALYLAWFPKLLQGPIERSGDLIPQLRLPYRFDYDDVRSGILLFAWGLFKKVVVADRLAFFSNQVFNNVNDYSGLSLIIGIYAYALQIYFDFAGYTDMARGTALLFGIKLSENFDSPYLATSIADFWRRWHISFSRWILDYIFKPLQMGWRNLGQAGTAFALIIAFLVSGIWHGASWGFVIWGLLHGIFLAVSTFYRPYQRKIYKKLRLEKNRLMKLWKIVVTFNLVCFTWIFFRAGSIRDAWYMITHLLTSGSSTNSIPMREYFLRNILMGQSVRESVVLFVALSCMAISGIVTGSPTKTGFPIFIIQKSLPVRWMTYYALALSILMFGIFYNSSFIYYKF